MGLLLSLLIRHWAWPGWAINLRKWAFAAPSSSPTDYVAPFIPRASGKSLPAELPSEIHL